MPIKVNRESTGSNRKEYYRSVGEKAHAQLQQLLIREKSTRGSDTQIATVELAYASPTAVGSTVQKLLQEARSGQNIYGIRNICTALDNPIFSDREVTVTNALSFLLSDLKGRSLDQIHAEEIEDLADIYVKQGSMQGLAEIKKIIEVKYDGVTARYTDKTSKRQKDEDQQGFFILKATLLLAYMVMYIRTKDTNAINQTMQELLPLVNAAEKSGNSQLMDLKLDALLILAEAQFTINNDKNNAKRQLDAAALFISSNPILFRPARMEANEQKASVAYAYAEYGFKGTEETKNKFLHIVGEVADHIASGIKDVSADDTDALLRIDHAASNFGLRASVIPLALQADVPYQEILSMLAQKLNRPDKPEYTIPFLNTLAILAEGLARNGKNEDAEVVLTEALKVLSMRRFPLEQLYQDIAPGENDAGGIYQSLINTSVSLAAQTQDIATKERLISSAISLAETTGIPSFITAATYIRAGEFFATEGDIAKADTLLSNAQRLLENQDYPGYIHYQCLRDLVIAYAEVDDMEKALALATNMNSPQKSEAGYRYQVSALAALSLLSLEGANAVQ